MTKEVTKKAIEVMRAFCEGKQIQHKSVDGVWENVDVPVWDFDKFVYRIKPEKKLRPYKDAEEFLQAQRRHGLYIERYDNNNNVFYDFPVTVCNTSIDIAEETGTFVTFLYDEITDFTWLDGTPCGIEEEE